MSELLPCPFCGEQPVSCFVGEDDGGYWSTECSTKNHFAGVHAMTQETAEAEWNARANVEGLVKLLEIAICPQQGCMGGAYPSGPEGEAAQCQWCYERDNALAEHAKTKEGE